MSNLNFLDIIFGSHAYEHDEISVEMGKIGQYPWRGTNILTGDNPHRRLRELKEERRLNNAKL